VSTHALAQGKSDRPDRGAFTLLLTLGYGIQTSGVIDESASGLSGLNLGAGGFLSENAALMFRLSGTNVTYDVGGLDFQSVSGVGALSVQYWLDDRFNVEGGPGFGFLSNDVVDKRGFGLVMGTGYSVFFRGKHSLQFGVEYAPVFVDERTIHNFGITFGYQFL
jgi:hypothetical protein